MTPERNLKYKQNALFKMIRYYYDKTDYRHGVPRFSYETKDKYSKDAGLRSLIALAEKCKNECQTIVIYDNQTNVTLAKWVNGIPKF